MQLVFRFDTGVYTCGPPNCVCSLFPWATMSVFRATKPPGGHVKPHAGLPARSDAREIREPSNDFLLLLEKHPEHPGCPTRERT